MSRVSESRINYVAEILSEHGVTATPEQVALIARDVANMEECLAMGGPDLPNPDREEADRLRKQLSEERSLVVCRECRGEGRLKYNIETFGVNTGCPKCRGKGRHKP